MKSEFKEFSELKEFDPRNFYHVFVDSGERITLEDIYNNIAAIKLNKAVPEKIVTQFDVAKNLAVYSCFVYSFHEPAKMQAYSTLEFALKDVSMEKNQKSKWLKWMLKKSLKLGLITEKSFTRNVSKEQFLEMVDIVVYFRNNMAHGTSTLIDDSPEMLRLCSNIINELYKNKELVKIAKVKLIEKPQKNTKDK